MMKKIIKAALFALLALTIALACLACSAGGQGDQGGLSKIDGKLPEFDREVTTAYGREPDLGGVIIDGKLDDQLWEGKKWYTQYNTTNRVGIKYTTAFSDGGLYVAACSTDKSIFWKNRQYFFSNTNISFSIIVDNGQKTFSIDANNDVEISKEAVNARSYVDGEINKIGGAQGLQAEFYLTWADLGINGGQRPESVFIMPTYNYKANELTSTLNSIYPTFVKAESVTVDDFFEFDATGYVAGDQPYTTIGDHEIGLGKTRSWRVETGDRESDEIVRTTNAETGKMDIYPQAIFFKEGMGSNFSLSTTITVNSAKNSPVRAGLLIYSDDVNYRAVAVEYSTDDYSDGVLHTLDVNAYTNYPANVTVTSDFCEIENKPDSDLNANQFEMLLIYNNGVIYYMINGEYVYSEKLDFLTSCYFGLYALNADAIFSDYDYEIYDSEEQTNQEIAKYAHTVSIENNSAFLSAEIDQIGVSKDGDGSVEISFTCNQGYTVSQLYYVTLDGEQVDFLEDATDSGANGKYVLTGIEDSITIFCDAQPIDAEDMVTLKMTFYDQQNGLENGKFTGARLMLTGSSAFTNYYINGGYFADGVIEVTVPSGYSWSYVADYPSYRPARGVIMNGEIIDADMQDVEIVEVTAPVVGGTAYSSGGGFTVASNPSTYWDLSNEENGEVTFQTTNKRRTTIAFSGPTISKYHVAYVEITNQTDPLAFTSMEQDPAIGFRLTNSYGDLDFLLRYTGMRIMDADDWATRLDASGLFTGYPGYISPTKNGIIQGEPYMRTTGNSVNRVAYNGREDTTCLLMVRSDTYLRFYVADGSQKVLPDKTNFDKLQLIYEINNKRYGGEGAISLALTVSFNLRVKFSNYWILAGEDALDFSDGLINSTVTPTGNAVEDVSLTGDVVTGDDGSFTVVSKQPFTITAGEKFSSSAQNKKLACVTFNGETKYLSYGESATYTMPDSGKNYALSINAVDAVTVSGSVNCPENKGAAASAVGRVLDGDEIVMTFDVNNDGTFSAIIPATAQNVDFISGDYASPRYEIDASRDNHIAQPLTLIRLPFGARAGSVTTTASGFTYYVDKDGNATAHYVANPASTTVRLAITEQSQEDTIVKFSYSRTNAAENGVTGKDDTDMGVGLYVTDGSAKHGLMFIGTGVRIFSTKTTGVNDAYNQRNLTSVNLGPTHIEQIDFMVIKRGSTFYMYSKYYSESQYKLVFVWNATDSGREVLSGRCDLAVQLTLGRNVYSNVKIFAVGVEDYSAEAIPSYLTSTLTATADGASVRVDEGASGVISASGSEYVVFTKTELPITITPDEGRIITAIKLNGHEQELKTYSGGAYTLDLIVTEDSQLVVETASLSDFQFISGSVVDKSGKPVVGYTVGTSAGFKAVTDKSGRFSGLLALPGEQVTFTGDSTNDYVQLNQTVAAENGQYVVTLESSILGGSAEVGDKVIHSGIHMEKFDGNYVEDHGYTITKDQNGNQIAIADKTTPYRTALMFTGVASDKMVVRASITYHSVTDKYPMSGFVFRDQYGTVNAIAIYGDRSYIVGTWIGWKRTACIEKPPHVRLGNASDGSAQVVKVGKVDMVCVYDDGNYDLYVRFSGLKDYKWYHLYDGKAFTGTSNKGIAAVGLAESCNTYSEHTWSDYSVDVGQEAIDRFYASDVVNG